MTKIKTIYLDLDGSLLSDDKSVSNRNIEAIEYCKEKGIKISICTSRSKEAIYKFLDLLKLDDCFHISQNGLNVFNRKLNYNQILEKLNREKYLSILDKLEDNKYTYFVFNDEKACFKSENDIKIIINDGPQRDFEKVVSNLKEINDVMKVSCLFHGEEEYKNISNIAEDFDLQVLKVHQPVLIFYLKMRINFLV